MSNNFETVIGIEIHIELNTKSKMFSPSANHYHSPPNTNLSIIDLGYPGAMPSVNKEAVIKAVKLAKALNMKIDNELHFDRKHYFYPDLPKGFQITQHFRPIGKNGEIKISNNRIIKIERIHLEEDTAKSLHKDNKTLLDYNRAGVPLIEIVSYPTIRNAKEAGYYIDAIRKLVRFLDISDAKMEEGSLRADLNISIRLHGESKLGTKVEIKNINSITNSQKAAISEIALQEANILEGIKIEQTTKRYDDKENKNKVMRAKKDVSDYKYFPEPNIPPISLSKHFIDEIKNVELPSDVEKEFKELGFNSDVINQIINDKEKRNFIKEINYEDLAKTTKLFFSEIVSLANKKNVGIKELEINPREIKYLLEQEAASTISNVHVKKIIPLLTQNKKASKIINEKGFMQISDENEINKLIDEVMKDNSEFIIKNKERKERVMKFLVGQIMKKSKGQVNPIITSKLVKIKLGD